MEVNEKWSNALDIPQTSLSEVLIGNIALVESVFCLCVWLKWPYKHYQVHTNEGRRRTSLDAMPTCLRARCGRMHAHIISSCLNLIWLVCPAGWGEELHPAGWSPPAAATHSAWSPRELVMRPAKFFSLLSFTGECARKHTKAMRTSGNQDIVST